MEQRGWLTIGKAMCSRLCCTWLSLLEPGLIFQRDVTVLNFFAIKAKGRPWQQTLHYFVLWTWNLQQPLGELLHHLPPASHGAREGTRRVRPSCSRPSLRSPTEPPQGSSGAADSNFASSRMRI